MPGISRQGSDSAGGKIISGAGAVFVNGANVAIIGSSIAGHGKSQHAGPKMAAGAGSVFAGGIGICRAGDKSTCGHVASGSGDVFVGGPGGGGGGGGDYGDFYSGGTGEDGSQYGLVNPWLDNGFENGGPTPRVSDPDWDYSAHPEQNDEHDRTFFAQEYLANNPLPTGVELLPRETRRSLLFEYARAFNVYSEVIPTGPDGNISFSDPNFRLPVDFKDYVKSEALARGWLKPDGTTTLPLDIDIQREIEQKSKYVQAAADEAARKALLGANAQTVTWVSIDGSKPWGLAVNVRVPDSAAALATPDPAISSYVALPADQRLAIYNEYIKTPEAQATKGGGATQEFNNLLNNSDGFTKWLKARSG